MDDFQNGVDVIINDMKNNPSCPHGPTLLFSRRVGQSKTNFFACAAYRDRKYCRFFMWKEETDKMSASKQAAWNQENIKFLKNINHRKLFFTLNKIQNMPINQRMFCHTCSVLDNKLFEKNHKGHNLEWNVPDDTLNHPSEMLLSLETSKKEAQYLFSKETVVALVTILQELGYKNVICIGTPRIHEFIRSKCLHMNSLLLDMDSRFHNFFGPLEFCWYNMFNHHFFLEEAKNVFRDFLQTNNTSEMVLITDPPFGGRVEPLANTFKIINTEFKNLNKTSRDLPLFWIFPYFMEPHIKNHVPNMTMLDYKVNYENHNTFNDGPKGRKQGSCIRIFTNVNPSLIKLHGDSYRYCKKCRKWVAKENKHCAKCNSCSSKDGTTYKHCDICDRCVKPTWEHCNECNRCALVKHKCEKLEFLKECFHCSQQGHKKSECPKLDMESKNQKRKSTSFKKSKKNKLL